MNACPDPLTTLRDHIIAHITGERRRRLVEYLLRWDEPAAALTYLDLWLVDQPHLATLREARARILIELGRGEDALAALDDLDAERGMSEGRRVLRMHALAALGRWPAAYALLPTRPDDPATWRLRADLLRQEGRFEAAADAYARAADLMPEGSMPLRGYAELALSRGDPASARSWIRRRQARFAGEPLDTRDLVLLRAATEQLGDAAELADLDAQLRDRRAQERTALCAVLGLDLEEGTETRRQGDTETRSQESGVRSQESDDGERQTQNSKPKTQNSPHPITPSPPHPLTEEPELPAEVHAALREHFGYASFRPGQSAVIARVLGGDAVLAVLPTGAGKSLTYQLPALLLPGATLVLSPLIALMKDQIDNLPPALAERATTIHSGLDGGAVAARLRGLADGRYKLVYVAPERLRQQPFVHALRRAGVARVVVDEAHCVSLWGISFRPDYLFIRRALDELGAPPVLALTATATPDTEAEIKAHLAPQARIPIHEAHESHEEEKTGSPSRPFVSFVDREMPTVRTSIFRPNLRFEVRHVGNKHDKFAAVLALCREIDGPIVVYARSRESCEELADHLRRHSISAEHYHALVADRDGVQERFMRGATRILVATVAFGMGVDKADIRAIIHYNLPQSVEAYYQEAGRAGRDSLPARCILLYAAADKGQLTAWLHQEALTKEHLRRVYAWLRKQVRGGWGVVALDDLRRDLREEDETRMRVALGLLERVGLVARHFDLPRAATLLLRDGMFGDPAFQSFVYAARLRPGQALDVDLLELAARQQCAPDELERRLLRWHDQGLLRYDGSARDLLLELRPAAADVSAQLDALLAEYAGRQDARIEAIAAYARGLSCRHRTIALHFGERLGPCGDACDICAPGMERRAARGSQRPARGARSPGADPQLPVSDTQAAVLAAVRELPGRLGEKELVCVLLGTPGYPACAVYGRLAGADFATTRRAVAALVAAGKLAYRNRALVLATPAARPSSAAAIDEVILRCLAHMPFPVGRSGLAKVLKGSAASPIGPERCPEHATLAHLTLAAIEATIEQLVERDYLARQLKGRLPLLALTERGAAALAGE